MSVPIVEQPRVISAKRDWQDGLFDCTNDCTSCLCVLFFAPCYMCHMYKRYGEFVLTPMLMATPNTVLRAQHRARQNIKGSILHDCLVDIFCGYCSMCQLDRDMKYVEATVGTLDV